jgi:hypothetical protein
MNKSSLTALFIATLLIGHTRAADPKMTLPPGFAYEDIYIGPGMISVDFDPAGRMYVCEKMGVVLKFEPKGKEFLDPAVLLDIKDKVNSENESGLLGMTLDPQFATNHYIYLFYTTNADQRLVRYTVNSTFTALTDELILLTGLPKNRTEHKSGDIHFSPTDPHSIYISVGDDTDRPKVDDITAFNGKILRVNSADGKGFADNPYSDGNLDSVASRVWALGLRNPFRFTFPPDGVPADTLYIAESGDNWDRIGVLTKGAKGGWGVAGDEGIRTPTDPKIHNLVVHKPSLTCVAIAKSGPFAAPDGSPVLYWENWYGPDIHRGILSGKGLDQFAQIATDPTDIFAAKYKCVNMKFGPDGSLYTTQTWYGDSPHIDSHLGRIKYVGVPAGAPTAPAVPAAAPATSPSAAIPAAIPAAK